MVSSPGSPSPASPSPASATSAASTPLLTAALRVRRADFALDVELALAHREVLVVLGPNGAGKSTTLRALAGLVDAEGPIELAGRRLEGLPTERRRIGMVFSDHLLFPHLDVTDNIAFAPRAGGRSRRDAAAIAAQWIARLELGALARRRPGQLSGGQSQRVALARALAGDPELLLLDEPLAALDGRTRLQVRSALRRELRILTRGAIVVTHDPIDAMVLADRVLVIEHGRVVQQGPPQHVAAHPSTDYLAQLFGLNLIPGTAVGGHLRPESGDGEVLSSDRGEGPVLAIFAPSAVSVLQRPPQGSPRNVWSATIHRAEPIGDLVRIDADVPSLGRSIRADVTPAAAADLDDHGSTVWLAVKAAEVRFSPR